MTQVDLIPILVIALVCGAAGQLTSGYSRHGWFMYMAVALVGAIGGVAAARAFDFPAIFSFTLGLHEFPLLWAVLGSVALVAGISLILKPRM